MRLHENWELFSDALQAASQPVEVNVLDRRRTLTEKLVSLLRCSLADNYMPELTAKIRHFYDLHFLLNDAETQDYLKSDAFKSDFCNLFVQRC